MIAIKGTCYLEPLNSAKQFTIYFGEINVFFLKKKKKKMKYIISTRCKFSECCCLVCCLYD